MKKFINVLAVVLALVMCLGLAVACGGEDPAGEGNGTTEAGKTTPVNKVTTPVVTTPEVTTTEEVTTADPEEDDKLESEGTVPANGVITNAAELHAVLNATDVSEQDFTVTATELDMSNRKWTGLKDYKGTFDFGNCKVKGVAYPMFTTVTGGTVKNLVVADSVQNYTNDEAKADATLVIPTDYYCFYYGGVIRYMNEGIVENITVENSVNIEVSIWENMNSGGTEGGKSAKGGFGGILGYATGSSVLVKDCTFKGTITTDSLIVNIGGVAGRVESGDAAALNTDSPADSSVLAINCYNYGTVYNLASGNDSKTGGVFGAFGTGAVVQCANYGTVDSADSGQSGGVVGQSLNLLYMYQCLNTGTVKGTSYVGGIIGYSNGSTRIFNACINLGTIDTTSARAGGIMGWCRNAEVFTECYSLKSAHANWVWGNNANIDPADPATHATEKSTATITGGGHLDTVDAIYAAIEATNPGVFVKANGSLDLAK